MENLILFTNSSSIQKHWEKSIDKKLYTTLYFEDFNNLLTYIQTLDKTNTYTLMFDERSVSNIDDSLEKISLYSFIKILLFHSMPNVNHALKLLKYNVYGYENSYIHKNNLSKMLYNISNKKKWFFRDLTNFIINNYIENTQKQEPDFFKLLTQQEKEIALMIADGHSNKEIAQSKDIALSTVKNHIHHIFEKAGVSDRFALALKFKS